ncbi:MAG: hypothetical protein ACKOOL_02270 [Novosphingobium sp.]
MGLRLFFIMLIVGFGGIASLTRSHDRDEKKTSNPWSNSARAADTEARNRAAGWGSSRQTGPRYETVYVDKDGVEHDKEDLKSYDPNEIVIHDRNGRVVSE